MSRSPEGNGVCFDRRLDLCFVHDGILHVFTCITLLPSRLELGQEVLDEIVFHVSEYCASFQDHRFDFSVMGTSMALMTLARNRNESSVEH